MVNAIFYFKPIQRFEYGGDMFTVMGFQFLCEQGSVSVNGDEIFVFAVSLCKKSYTNPI